MRPRLPSDTCLPVKSTSSRARNDMETVKKLQFQLAVHRNIIIRLGKSNRRTASRLRALFANGFE
jgi:hypothetical protein